ncbi:hypothetical protein [Microcoleus sp. PH2017_02_FOX_O_A]|uniref:hypothetical protein n=1 Tax=Microcoleus sp. PH2017_02_FOX_O_A TaxID=2798813 RepID=UPI001DA28745|nr:hypothetical protein [Microcoleus sp. PH2017_02_FOX_O_A]MCC3412415.1 hypothetical protein [Microcoleus sp. PH2017_02_FOX_O_A]
MLPERLVRRLSEPPYPLQCLLFAYLSGSAIFMQNFCIIYKTLHNSRRCGLLGRSQMFGVCVECYNRDRQQS